MGETTNERTVRAIPGLGYVEVQATMRWADGVTPHPILTEPTVDLLADGYLLEHGDVAPEDITGP